MVEKSHTRTDDAADEISLYALANLILRHRRLLIGLPLGLFVVVVTVSMLMPRTHTATSSFTLEGPNTGGASRIAALGAQFGLDLGGAVNAEASPQFAAELVTSRRLLEQVLETEFRFDTSDEPPETLSGTIPQLYDVEADIQRRKIDLIRRMVKPEIDAGTGLVTLQVATRWPRLSELLNRRLLELLQEFNLNVRQTRAREEREFVEGQMEVAQRDLRAAENGLKTFLEQNRRVQSPELLFEQRRLNRRLDEAQALYTSLAQAYQQARIEEVRNTPVLTVVDRPEGSAYPTSRGTIWRGIIALLLGGLVALTLALVRDYTAREEAEESPEYYRFRQLRKDVARDFGIGRSAAPDPHRHTLERHGG